jgi:hypothetical protein
MMFLARQSRAAGWRDAVAAREGGKAVRGRDTQFLRRSLGWDWAKALTRVRQFPRPKVSDPLPSGGDGSTTKKRQHRSAGAKLIGSPNEDYCVLKILNRLPGM